MSAVTRETGYRVVVEPRRLGDFGRVSVSDGLVTRDAADALRKYKERCTEIVLDIRRHVDNVGWVGVEAETEKVCQHCGYIWGKESDAYNGGCCAEDQQAEDDRAAARGEA